MTVTSHTGRLVPATSANIERIVELCDKILTCCFFRCHVHTMVTWLHLVTAHHFILLNPILISLQDGTKAHIIATRANNSKLQCTHRHANPADGRPITLTHKQVLRRYTDGLINTARWIMKKRTHIDGILPKRPYPPCLRMADRTVLAGYPRYGQCSKWHYPTWVLAFGDMTNLCDPFTNVV